MDEILLGSRVLSGVDRYGSWSVNTLDGWWDSPEPKGDVIGRANSDGEFDLPIFNESRLITVGGLLQANSHTDQHEAMNALSGFMRGRFQVAGHGSDQWVDVKKAAGFRFTPITDTLAQWQLGLKAPDPRKYGGLNETNTASSQVVFLHHYGNAPATPKIRVTGDFPTGYYISGPSERIYRVIEPLGVGGVHEIDFNTGLISHNGTVKFGYTSNARLWSVPPGGTARVAVHPNSTGTGQIRFQVLDTFI